VSERTFANGHEAWHTLARELPEKGNCYRDQTGQACCEYNDVLLVVRDPSDAAALVRALRHSLPTLYPSIEEIRSLCFSHGPVFHDWTLGRRLFGEPGQVDSFVIPLLKEHPSSRRAVIIPYEPATDSQLSTHSSPVLLSVQVRVRDEKVVLSATIRSCDAYLGLPTNLYELRALQEYIAHALKRECGSIAISFASLHSFERYGPEVVEVTKAVQRLLNANNPSEGKKKKGL
jgi:hypothetical protein